MDLQNLINLESSDKSISDVNVVKLAKKKRKSIFDENQEKIVIPESVSEYAYQLAIQTANEKQQEFQQFVTANQRFQERVKQQQQHIPMVIQQQQAREDLQILTTYEIPEEVNILELEKQIDDAIKNVADDIDITDIELSFSKTEKTKKGYYKNKVTISTNSIPSIVNKIATYVKIHSKGVLLPRVVDLRVIGNTNKTQLKNNKLKLSSQSVLFKPNHEKLKVNKYNRFMISIPENFESTGNILCYIQESRKKSIIELKKDNFISEEAFINFIGDKIAMFYFHGYDVTYNKLIFKGTFNPLSELIHIAVESGKYRAKLYSDDDGKIYSVDFDNKDPKNEWLFIRISETSVFDRYELVAKNFIEDNWEYQIVGKPLSLDQLKKGIINVLDTCFNRDWSKELNLNEKMDLFIYEFKKIKHNQLKIAAVEINDISDSESELEIEIKKILSKKDTIKLMNGNYDSESIIGKTKFCDYFILTYLAYPIIGGDKRHGKDYITRQQYYQKYNVKDKREYQERDNTVLVRQKTDRNYNARIYMFQLEYSVNNKKYVYRNTDWEIIKNVTGILTDNIMFPMSKY
jgi:hypothetical protein